MSAPKIAVQSSSKNDTRKPDILVYLENEGFNYDLKSNPEEADYLFLFSQPLEKMLEWSHTYKHKVLILLTGEAYTPDFNLFDYAFGFDTLTFGDRYLQIQQHALFNTNSISDAIKSSENIRADKSKFCNFIYSNPNAHPSRDRFFELLSAYKKVDSLGSHLKNVDFSIGERQSNDFFEESVKQKQPYRFSIAFENAMHPGYNTEKIMSSMMANSIPIYWGDPDIAETYNTKSFINCHDYASFDKVIEVIMTLENTPEKYQKMLQQPWRTPAQQQKFEEKKAQFKAQLNFIFSQPYKKAFRKPVGTYNNMYTEKLALLKNKEDSIGKIIKGVKKRFTR